MNASLNKFSQFQHLNLHDIDESSGRIPSVENVTDRLSIINNKTLKGRFNLYIYKTTMVKTNRQYIIDKLKLLN